MAHTDEVKHFVWIKLKDFNQVVLAYFPDDNSIPYVMEDTCKGLGYEIEKYKAVSKDKIINGEDIDGFWLYPLRDFNWERV